MEISKSEEIQSEPVIPFLETLLKINHQSINILERYPGKGSNIAVYLNAVYGQPIHPEFVYGSDWKKVILKSRIEIEASVLDTCQKKYGSLANALRFAAEQEDKLP